jgi:serine/threonine protein kinase
VSTSTDFEALERLTGMVVPSGTLAGVTFRLERVLGAGGVGVVFGATRSEGGTQNAVVVKVLRPSLVTAGGSIAPASVRKEAVALGRLNQHVPPTPFVVRLVDAGDLDFVQRAPLRLPWLAIERVNGGEEGTTLEDRVQFACKRTGSAFDPTRAARAIRCLASGLGAIHGVDIVHRDLTPGNVLCCGFGDSEVFKISDFGLSRSAGMVETFGKVMLGTPGYAAPEQSFPAETGVGSHSDVFGFGCLVYFLLTGEPYFPAKSLPQALVLARAPERRSVMLGKLLAPELRERGDVCEAVDRALAAATAYDPLQRPQHIQYLSAMLAPLLAAAGSVRPSQRHVDSVASHAAPVGATRWAWTVRHAPGDGRVIYAAAWDGDGTCLASTTHGLEFWNGTQWLSAPIGRLPLPQPIRLVHRVDAGSWLLGASDGSLALYTFEGAHVVGRAGAGGFQLVTASGHLDDLLVAVTERDGGGIELSCMSSHRWMKPLPVPQAASIMTLSRIDDARWLIGGRSRAGSGFAALLDPLQWDLTPLLVPANRAFITSDGTPEKGTGIVAGAAGHVVHVERTRTSVSRIPDECDVSAVATDVFDRQWASTLGRLWLRADSGGWTCIWQDPRWAVPFIRLFPDAGVVLALTADGGVLEGRAVTG